MSEDPSNVNGENHQSPNKDEAKSELWSDKKKLSLSQSENKFDQQKGIKHKLLGKVKSWSSKDQHLKNKCFSVELDLARSLSRLEVSQSVDNIGSSLLRARDSLDNLLKDEQNMPKSSLEKSILQHKPRNISDSPKSSPQLGENTKASSSKMPFWDNYCKKNRKDAKKKAKTRILDSPRADVNAICTEGKKTSIMKKGDDNAAGGNSINEESSIMEEEHSYKFKYFPQNSKSVVFTNEVLVVYFNNEDVVGEEKEPLKKEVEQQTRNKEMRRIHLNKTQEKNNICLF